MLDQGSVALQGLSRGNPAASPGEGAFGTGSAEPPGGHARCLHGEADAENTGNDIICQLRRSRSKAAAHRVS